MFHKENFNKMRVCGQFNLGFILAVYGQDLFIIDQVIPKAYDVLAKVLVNEWSREYKYDAPWVSSTNEVLCGICV